MATIKFNTENLISLTKLEKATRKEYGQRFNLAENASLLSLLKLAGESSNQTIQLAYFQFLGGLEDKAVQQLKKAGVNVRSSEAILSEAVVVAEKKVANGSKVAHLSPVPQRSNPANIESSDKMPEADHVPLDPKDGLPAGVKKVIYRGKTIYKKDGKEIADPYSVQKSPVQPQEKAGTKKAKRVYRGKVLEWEE